MDHQRTDDSESRFAEYVEGLASVIGHKDREEPLRHYCTGLLMPCERKSVEPMAAITAPDRTAAQHQSLLHFIGVGKWSDAKVLAKVREMVLPHIERHGALGTDGRRLDRIPASHRIPAPRRSTSATMEAAVQQQWSQKMVSLDNRERD